jgi:hypothetical protein
MERLGLDRPAERPSDRIPPRPSTYLTERCSPLNPRAPRSRRGQAMMGWVPPANERKCKGAGAAPRSRRVVELTSGRRRRASEELDPPMPSGPHDIPTRGSVLDHALSALALRRTLFRRRHSSAAALFRHGRRFAQTGIIPP